MHYKTVRWGLAAAIAGMILFASAAQAQQSHVSAGEARDAAPYAVSHSAAAPPNSPVTGEGYVIGIGDVVAISVWKETELSRTMPVRPDGKISLPVIGEIRAAGLTAAQLQAQIVDKLDIYIRNPQANVIVQEIRSRTFNVMGKVAKPGAFDLIKPTTVLDAIAQAGGFQEYAKVTHIYVLRPQASGLQSILPFNYKAVIKGKRPAENVQIQPGDTVVIP